MTLDSTMVHTVRSITRALSSLRLTVVLLALCMILVFAATLAQVELGIHEVQQRHLRAWIAWFDLAPGEGKTSIPFPGGMLLGSLLLLNLVAAHATRFEFHRKKAGIVLVHLGIILLLLGELFTAVLAEESQMTLDEGQARNYSTASREIELAIVDASEPGVEVVTAIPMSRLRDGERFDLEGFSLRIVRFFRNSEVVAESSAGPNFGPTRADRGPGTGHAVRELPHETAMDRIDHSSAFVEVFGADGKSLGTWLLSSGFPTTQNFGPEGRPRGMALRQRRHYYPFSIRLLDFTHDRYLGTQIPKNFSSRIRLENPAAGENRETLVYMNHPLRYQGLTFYQSGFANNDRTSILHVVRNPVWTLPYLACSMVGLGLLWIFSQHLAKAVTRKRPAPSPSP
ncbi:cytochrome c biogenesis protein ResB [Luteolibacter arcticus]|uniref:Cytochrome c biogenesis protein ResB n=1 Tax=Luteolibacter arcticus TaxID=1581411 RepID=A0ABT3GNT5_9BACT|nr:cytochrome c biogenesis protein ResB [Luteolibacter arcticus]MCW1925185.1 cytochrome c biogenesis protein ResB [Luteolibacter arcticus]